MVVGVLGVVVPVFFFHFFHFFGEKKINVQGEHTDHFQVKPLPGWVRGGREEGGGREKGTVLMVIFVAMNVSKGGGV